MKRVAFVSVCLCQLGLDIILLPLLSYRLSIPWIFFHVFQLSVLFQPLLAHARQLRQRKSCDLYFAFMNLVSRMVAPDFRAVLLY